METQRGLLCLRSPRVIEDEHTETHTLYTSEKKHFDQRSDGDSAAQITSSLVTNRVILKN